MASGEVASGGVVDSKVSSAAAVGVQAADVKGGVSGEGVFREMLRQEGLGAGGGKDVSVDVGGGEDVEKLKAELEDLRKRALSVEELESLKAFAALGYQEAERRRLESLRGQNQTQEQGQTQTQAQNQVQVTRSLTGVVPITDEEMMWLTTDPSTGEMRELPGAPAGTLAKWNLHRRSLLDALPKFMSDPMRYLGDEVKKLAAEAAAKIVEDRLAGRSGEEAGRNIVEKHKGWLYERDEKQPDGIKRHSISGQPVLTENGQLYLAAIEELYAGGKGITDPVKLDQMASKMLLGIIAERKLQSVYGQNSAKDQQTKQAIESTQKEATQKAETSKTPWSTVINQPLNPGASIQQVSGLSLTSMINQISDAAKNEALANAAKAAANTPTNGLLNAQAQAATRNNNANLPSFRDFFAQQLRG